MTHLYFAHSLVWATPLLSPDLRRAIQRFPELVMAGACLPDLAIVSQRFKDSHQWQHAQQLIALAQTDEEKAIAIGYTSHLYIDVIAHNHFVPAHEAMWLENSPMTHIISEWAMDAYLTPLITMRPGQLLIKYELQLLSFAKHYFQHEHHAIRLAIRKLAYADNLLRHCRLPCLLLKMVTTLDKRVHRNFIYYVARTQDAMAHIGHLFDGHVPSWEADPASMDKHQKLKWNRACVNSLLRLKRRPIEYFSTHLFGAYD